MLTILEGPDGGGKTTLARELHDRGLGKVLHQGPFDGDPFNETLSTLRPYLDHGLNVIWDRSHLGEQVYGPIYRGVDSLGTVKRRMLERYLLSHQAVVVLCYPPFPVAQATWQSRRDAGEEMFFDRFREMYQAWLDVETELPMTGYSYRSSNADRLYRALRHLRTPKNLGPGVGHFAAGVTLLLGDQVSLRVPGPKLPFIGDSGCSLWLTELLEEADVPERKLYWANVRDPNGGWTDLSFIDILRPSRVIALGNMAHERLTDAEVEFEWTWVPHPQHWKRFRNRDPYPLLDYFTRKKESVV